MGWSTLSWWTLQAFREESFLDATLSCGCSLWSLPYKHRAVLAPAYKHSPQAPIIPRVLAFQNCQPSLLLLFGHISGLVFPSSYFFFSLDIVTTLVSEDTLSTFSCSPILLLSTLVSSVASALNRLDFLSHFCAFTLQPMPVMACKPDRVCSLLRSWIVFTLKLLFLE